MVRHAMSLALGMFVAGSAAASGEPQSAIRAADASLAAIHSDIAFAVTVGPRRTITCSKDECSSMPDSVADAMFETKVKHIAAILEDGVRELVPGIDAMVPGAADGLFDVFVVDSHEWATASSASGKIAVSSRLAGAIGMEDLLAYLIAREMVHVVVSHHEQNSAASIITSIAMNLVIPGSGLIKSAVSLGGAAIAANANREEQERRADELASVVLRAAGFNPQEAHTAIALFSRSPAFADWSGRLRATAGHVLAKANAATGQNANAKASATAAAESQKPGGGQKALRIQPAGVVSFVAGGAIIQTSTEDLRKVAASSGRATSYYND